MQTTLYRFAHGRLVPASGRAKEELRKAHLQDGDYVAVKLIKTRNPKLAGLAYVVFAKIGEAIGVSAAAVEAQIKLALGYVDLVERPDGRVEPSPKRLDFETVPDENDYREFWDQAVPLICERILPSMPDDEVEELLTIINGRADGMV